MIRKIMIVLLLSLELFAVSQEGLVYKNRDTVIALLKNEEVAFSNLDLIYQNDRQIALLALDIDPYEFEYLNSNLKKDREIVKKAVSFDGFLLEYADSSLREDKELLNLALKSSGYGLEFFDEKYRDNKDFVSKVIEKNPFALEYASQRLKGDEELVLMALEGILEEGECDENPDLKDVSKFIDKILLHNKSFLIKLLKIAPYAESIIPKELKKDKEILTLIDSFSGVEEEDVNLSVLSREEALGEIKENPWVFPDLNTSFRKDKEFVRLALRYSPEFLEYVDESLKKDRTFMLPLFYEDVMLLEYMDDDFKNDKSLLSPLIYDNPIILDYMGEKLKQDNAFILDIFHKTGEGFEYLNNQQKQDKIMIKTALKNNEYNFQYVDEKLKDDKAFILELLADFDIYEDISNRLKKDREIILVSLTHSNPVRLDNAPKIFLKDESFIEEAIRRNGFGFKYATKEQQRNRTLVKEAVKLHAGAFQYVDKSFRKDRAFIFELLKEGSNIFPYIDEKLQGDRALVLEMLEIRGNAYSDLNETQQEDEEYIKKAIATDGWVFFDLSEDLQSQRKFMELALQSDGWTLESFPDDLKRDRALIKLALNQNGWVIKVVPKPLNRDKELLLIALRENGLALEYVAKDLREDRELVLAALQEDPGALIFVDNNLSKDKELLIEAINTPKLFKYMDKTLLEDKSFMKRLKEVTGFIPNIDKNKKQNVDYPEAFIDVNTSLIKEKSYKSYEDYYIHKSTWNTSVDISKNQKYLVSSNEGTINIWDVNHSFLFKQIEIEEEIRDLILLDDEKSILTLTDKEIKIWDIESSMVKKVLYKSNEDIFRMVLSSNQKWLAFLDINNMMYIYNLEHGTILKKFKITEAYSLLFSIDNDAKYLVSAGYWNNEILLWDIKRGKVIKTLYGHAKNISALYLSPHHDYLFSADDGGQIKVWDMVSIKLIRTLIDDEEVESLDMSSDGKWLLSSSHGIKIWDFKLGSLFKHILSSTPYGGYAKFINKNKAILSYGHNSAIGIIDVNSSRVITHFNTLKRCLYGVFFSPDKRYMYSVFRGGDIGTKIAIWNIQNNSLFKVLESNSPQNISALSISKDNQYLFIAYGHPIGGGEGIHVEMWDIQKNRLLKVFRNSSPKAQDRENIFDLMLSSDGKYLATYLNSSSAHSNGVELWSVERTELIKLFLDEDELSTNAFVISQDSRWLIIGDKQGKLNFWRLADNKLVQSQQVSSKPIDSIVLFDKDKLLVSTDNKIYLRSLTNRKTIQIFNLKDRVLYKIISSSNGENFATLSRLGWLNIWNINQEESIQEVNIDNRYADMGSIIDLTEDGKKIIIGHDDCSLKLYDIDNLKEAKQIFIFGNKENWVVFNELKKKMTFSDNGKFLLEKQQDYHDKNITVWIYKEL